MKRDLWPAWLRGWMENYQQEIDYERNNPVISLSELASDIDEDTQIVAEDKDALKMDIARKLLDAYDGDGFQIRKLRASYASD